MPKEASGHVQSLAKAIRILECLAEARRPLSLDQLCRRTGYPKSTLYGLLNTMRPSAVIEQSPDGKYRLGIRLFEFGCVVSGMWDVVAAGREVMQHIVLQTGESVCLSVLDRGEVMVLDQAEARSAYHVVSESGARLPAHCTSQGKALLAYQSPSVLRQVVEAGLQAYTPHTICTGPELEADLALTRRQGYAVENGEFRVGLRSVAAPVFDQAGQARYAIAVIGMFRSIHSGNFEQAARLIGEGAAKISHALGYRGQLPCTSF